MTELTGSETEYRRDEALLRSGARFRRACLGYMLEPLQSKQNLRHAFDATELGQESWRSLVEEPLGCAIERTFAE